MAEGAKKLGRHQQSKSSHMEGVSLRFSTKLIAVHVLEDLHRDIRNSSDTWSITCPGVSRPFAGAFRVYAQNYCVLHPSVFQGGDCDSSQGFRDLLWGCRIAFPRSNPFWFTEYSWVLNINDRFVLRHRKCWLKLYAVIMIVLIKIVARGYWPMFD